MRSLLCAVHGDEEVLLVHLPENLVHGVRSITSADHWYMMISDPSGGQTQELVDIAEDGGPTVVFYIKGTGYDKPYHLRLTCSYNKDKKCFQVDSGIAIPDDLGKS